jgi:hypothetical protein
MPASREASEAMPMWLYAERRRGSAPLKMRRLVTEAAHHFVLSFRRGPPPGLAGGLKVHSQLVVSML